MGLASGGGAGLEHYALVRPIPAKETSPVYFEAGQGDVRPSVRSDIMMTNGSEAVLIRELRWHSGQL